jgi:hypothetical protein
MIYHCPQGSSLHIDRKMRTKTLPWLNYYLLQRQIASSITGKKGKTNKPKPKAAELTRSSQSRMKVDFIQ